MISSVAVNAAHVLGAVAGFWLIARLAGSALSDRRFWLATAGLSLVMGLFLLAVSEPFDLFKDFYWAYFKAGAAVLAGPEALRPELEKGVAGFVNLPILAYLFTPFAVLPYRAAGPAFLIIGVAAALLAWHLLRRRYQLDRRESGITLFAIAAFGPFVYSLREGNTSHILLLPLIVGFILAGMRRDFSAGALFAAAAIVKPPLVLLGGYYLLRGRFRVIAGATVFGLAVLALSLLVFGWDMHLLWIREFAAYSGKPMAGYNDQSIASALLRFERGFRSFRDFTPYELSSAFSALNLVVVLSLAAIGIWVCRRPMPARSPLTEDLEPALVLTFILIASTVSWSHYYVWLMPALVLLFVVSRRAAPALRLWVWAAYALSAPAIFLGPLLEQGMFGHKVSSLLVSYLLIAGLLIYGLLIRLRMTGLAAAHSSAPDTRTHSAQPGAAPAMPAPTDR